MAIDYEKIMKLDIPEIEQEWTARDTMLYALGVGLGNDPVDRDELRFLYEKDLQALPTQAVVMAYPGSWIRQYDVGIDYLRMVNGGNSFAIHKALPVEGTFIGKIRVTGVIDKGEGRGALVNAERKVYDKATGDHLCTVGTSSFLRGQGGFGGPSGPEKPIAQIPDRPWDLACDLTTLPQSALIYRLSGDYNPLHADPDIATKAGFDRPIAHGLLTYGVAGNALLKTVCGYDPSKLKSMEGRFSAPVFPGDTVRTEMWQDGSEIIFRSVVAERDAVVINNGRAEIAE